MSLTNAQAALQAAATVYQGGRGHTTPASVKLLAESFKNWLDAQPPSIPVRAPSASQLPGPRPPASAARPGGRPR